MALLSLTLNNQTVGIPGEDGTPTAGYSTEEIFLLIQGKLGGNPLEKIEGTYHYLDWESGFYKKKCLQRTTIKK